MAKILTEEVLKALKKFDLPKGYQRTGEFPLDPSSIFSSKADADLYAAGGADSRGLSGTRYAGQLIAVVENSVTTLYTVEANDTLKAVGGDVTADLADLTGKVNAILDGESIDSFKDVEDALAALPKDMVVSGGEVRKPTTEEIAADASLDVDKEYIVLTIKNAETGKDKLFIAADTLVDVYSSGDEYINIADHKVTANISVIETKLSDDGFAKKSDITDITDALATKESLNEVKSTADAAAAKADANEGRIGTLENVVGKAAEGEQAATGLVKDIVDVKSVVADIKVKDVDTTASNGVNLTLSAEGKVGVNVVAADVADSVYATIKAKLDEDGVKSDTSKVSLSGKIGDENGTSYAAGKSVQEVLSDINDRIDANSKSIEAAVAGGVVAVVAGDGVSVDATTSTQPKVSVKLAENSNLAFDDNKALSLVWIEE